MNVPKISLKSTIDKSVTDSSTKITNQINISTGEKPAVEEIKANYTPSGSNDLKDRYEPLPVARSLDPTVNPEIIMNPYGNIQAYDTVQCSGQELNDLIAQNKNLKAINKASEIIIEMMKNNPIYVSALIITDDIKLSELVQILTDAESVNIDSEVLFTSCCRAYEYRKVNAIYVMKGGATLNLKYDFPEVTARLKDLGINSKFVF